MSIDLFGNNQNFQLDGYTFDEYFNALISPVPNENSNNNNKRQEITPSLIREMQKLKETNNDIKSNQIPKLEPNLPSNMNTNLMNNFHNNMMNMLTNFPSNMNNGTKVPMINANEQLHKPIRKRKNLAEASKDVLKEDDDGTSPTKKNKKTPKIPKKKERSAKKKKN